MRCRQHDPQHRLNRSELPFRAIPQRPLSFQLRPRLTAAVQLLRDRRRFLEMASPRYTKVRDTRDGNHAEIVAFLRCHGIEVIETERPLDILIRRGDGVCGFAEIKTTARNASIRRSQLEFMSETDMPVAFVKSDGEALIFAETMEGLTRQQKDALGVFLTRETASKWHPAAVERVILNG